MNRFSLLLALACLLPLHAQETYAMNHSFSLRSLKGSLSKVIAVLPVPQTNQYQEISAYHAAEGEVLRAKDNDNKVLRKTCTATDSAAEKAFELSESYEVTLYPMFIDMEQFKEIYPYRKSSTLYKRYTASDGVYIDADNPDIRSLSETLWKDAGENIIHYAEACYLYVAKNFRYQHPTEGIQPIRDILRRRGGNCGNLSAVFINLLRARGIPAKHIVTVRPDGSYHIWADFYLEKYGWIPVDVTLKHEHPRGHYFGVCLGNGVIVSEGLCSDIEFEPDDNFRAPLLQTYCFWYWHKDGNGKVSPSIRIVGTRQTAQPAIRVTDIQPHTATLRWSPFAGATGYQVKVIEPRSGENIQTLEAGESDLEMLIENLTPSMAYKLVLIPQRKVGNIMTTMGEYTKTLQPPRG